MATYSDSEPPRHRRERRPRIVDESDSDDYPPRREPRRQRAPPPRDSGENVPVKPTRHDDSDYRRSGRGSGEPRASRRDLERKNSQENIRFRKKRDGYESDEGEALRRSRSAREPGRSHRRPYDDDTYDDYGRKGYEGETLRPPRAGAADAAAFSLPLRGKRRDPEEPPVAYGAAPIPVGAPEPPPAASSRTADYARDTMPTRRDTARGYEGPYAEGPPPRRDDPRGYSRRPDYEDRGYRSDGPSRRHHERYDRDNRDDRYGRGYDDYRDRRRRDDGYRSGGERRAPRPKYDEYYSDHRGDRERSRRHDRDGRGEKDRYRDGDYDRRDRRYDYDRPRSYYDDRDRSGRKKTADWQKEAGVLFTTYAMPVIKKEGAKLFKDQMQKFLAKKQTGQL